MQFVKFADPVFAPANLLPTLLLAMEDAEQHFNITYRRKSDGALVLIPGGGSLKDLLTQPQSRQFWFIPDVDRDHPVYVLPEDLHGRELGRERGHPAPADTGFEPGECLPPSPRVDPDGEAACAEIGILDAGIAFWNPAFWDTTGAQSRFATFSGLCMEPGKEIARVELAPQDVTAMAQNGRAVGGDRKNRRMLAEALTSSVFAQDAPGRELASPQGLSHGTAMADMILSTAPAEARLHGMELPRRALRDLNGATMRSILHQAVRELVQQAADHRARSGDHGRFRMVILVAFGFVGGPRRATDGLPDVLQNLQQTIADMGRSGIDLEIVLPMGNHRQHQLHAVVPQGQPLRWRLQPDDHSANTLEIFHKEPLTTLKVTAPNGREGFWQPDKGGVSILQAGGHRVGALWTQAIGAGDQTQWRTRLTLMPTAGRLGQKAPFGLWHITLPDAKSPVEAWILRDETGFEYDPARPMRSSWFEDPHYRDRDAFGLPQMEDAGRNGDPAVRRAGSASVLTLGSVPGVVTVGAAWRDPETGALHAKPYSGAPAEEGAPDVWTCLETSAAPDQRLVGPFGQCAVLGNGTDRRFRVAGTSLAAALVTGERSAAPDTPSRAITG